MRDENAKNGMYFGFRTLNRRDVVKFGLGAAMVGMVRLPAAFAQQAGTIYAPGGYAESTPPQDQQTQSSQDIVYVCPMDPDVRSNAPGVCPRCGMMLVAGIPDYTAEYGLRLKLTPAAPKPGEMVRLDFSVFDPYKKNPVSKFEVVHEKLFHLFVVSQNLEFFVHEHPEPNADGTFTFAMKFPKPGMYRILSDFYPTGGTPQLVASTIFLPGEPAVRATMLTELSPKDTENMHFELVTDPSQPIAGMKSILRCHVGPMDGFEQLLGAWAHLLAVSDDTVDMIHTHPTFADGGPDLQFNLIFPRPRPYRLWIQCQRKGVVNTARFDIGVRSVDEL